MKTQFLILCLSASTMLGCSDTETIDHQSDANVDDGMCSETDGQTACTDVFCEANSYCDKVLCLAGCQSSANCGMGQYCDKAGSTTVGEAGVCRDCTTGGQMPGVDASTVSSACDDVTGNYAFMPKSSNPTVCDEFNPSGPCSIIDDGVNVSLRCFDGGDSGEQVCSLNRATCSCSKTIVVQGYTAELKIDFAKREARASGSGLVCEYIF